MEKILSQDEVNALLQGLSDGEIDTTKEEEDKEGVRIYDLTNQEKIIRGRMPTLEIINERFSRFFNLSLSATLRKTVDISFASIEIKKFGEFIKNIPLPASFNVIKKEPLRGYSLFVIDARLIFLFIDHLFGGGGQTHVKTEGREFTSIEHKIIRKIVKMALEDMEKAWNSVYPINIHYSRHEVNPQFAGIVTPTEVVISVVFNVEIENESRDIYMCIPYSSIEPIKEKLYAGFQSDQLEVDNEWLSRFRDRLLNCKVHITSEMGRASIRVEDVLNIGRGDVIVLEKGVNEEMYVNIEGVPKFKGHPGIYKCNQAIQISSIIWKGGEEIDG
ncbi:MAG: flagellar motor switch protein FliM [Nitrospirota bacterium]